MILQTAFSPEFRRPIHKTSARGPTKEPPTSPSSLIFFFTPFENIIHRTTFRGRKRRTWFSVIRTWKYLAKLHSANNQRRPSRERKWGAERGFVTKHVRVEACFCFPLSCSLSLLRSSSAFASSPTLVGGFSFWNFQRNFVSQTDADFDSFSRDDAGSRLLDEWMKV